MNTKLPVFDFGTSPHGLLDVAFAFDLPFAKLVLASFKASAWFRAGYPSLKFRRAMAGRLRLASVRREAALNL